MDKKGGECGVTEVNSWIIIGMEFWYKDWWERIEDVASWRMMGWIPSPCCRDTELWRIWVNRTFDGGDHPMGSALRWCLQDETVWTIMRELKWPQAHLGDVESMGWAPPSDGRVLCVYAELAYHVDIHFLRRSVLREMHMISNANELEFVFVAVSAWCAKLCV